MLTYDAQPHDIMIDIDELPSIADMVSTAGVLDNYPLVDQLHEPTSDALADENARMNCVFASYAGEVKYLCRPDHQDANGDFIKDSTPGYGQGYTGGSAAERIAPTVKTLYGVDTETYHATSRADILAHVINSINLGRPALITMPSAWNSQPDQPGYNPDAPNFPTHAGGAFGFNPTTHELLVANPWGGFIHRQTFDWWVRRFCYLKCYPSWKIGAAKMPVPTGWTDAGGHLTNPQTSFFYEKGMRQHVLDAPYWDPVDVPIENEHQMPAGVPFELSNPTWGDGDLVRVQQRGRKSWLAARQLANGTWIVIEEWVGIEADFLRREVDRLTAENATLKAAPPPPPPPITTRAAVDKVEADLKDAGKL